MTAGFLLISFQHNQGNAGQMNRLISISILLMIFLLFKQFLLAKDPENDGILFHIIRSRDTDKILYQVNRDKKGDLIAENPIDIFWIRQSQNNQKEPLTRMQSKYAYGLNFIEADAQHAVFKFVSFSDKTFILQKDERGIFRVFTHCKNREMIVNSLFVHFANDSFWFPKIHRIELYATETTSESLILEYIVP